MRDSHIAEKKYWKISRVVEVITSENIEFIASGWRPLNGYCFSLWSLVVQYLLTMEWLLFIGFKSPQSTFLNIFSWHLEFGTYLNFHIIWLLGWALDGFHSNVLHFLNSNRFRHLNKNTVSPLFITATPPHNNHSSMSK